jgi:hypothetical protein
VPDGVRLNAADLQIGATVNLLLAIEDRQQLIEGRPAAALARRAYDPIPGRVPVGAIPAAWLPRIAAAA